MSLFSKEIAADLQLIRERSPLILNITNHVVMNTTANVLLAMGASPIMSQATEEIADLAALSSAVVINMGTLDPAWELLAEHAIRAANQHQIPVIFDPVGAGASQYRTSVALGILQRHPVTVLRGNASEIISLANLSLNSHGVDSNELSNSALPAAKKLQTQYQHTIVISGATDIALDHELLLENHTGTAGLKQITGMGCSTTAVIAAFACVNQQPTIAAHHALHYFGKAAERAAETASGPGSLYRHLLDQLFLLSHHEVNHAT